LYRKVASGLRKSSEGGLGQGGQVPDPAISLDELKGRLEAEFPEAFRPGGSLSILRIAHGEAQLRYAFRPRSLRPGGTISGPTMMILADSAMYVAVLASIGWVPLAVTTNLSIHFLKKPGPRALDAECRLLKLGKRLAVGEISIRSEGEDELAAHAVATYSIPARHTVK
jgi:uncharacterized protein (TIGR00369 family)